MKGLWKMGRNRIKGVLILLLGIIISVFFFLMVQPTSSIRVSFVDQNNAKLRVKGKMYHSKRYWPLRSSKLEKEVPGYKMAEKKIFFKKENRRIVVRFMPKNYRQEISNFDKANYIAATFQPMKVSPKGGYQSDPYNTARTYSGDKTGQDTLRLLYSNDGKSWKRLHISSPRLNIRDPSIIKVKKYWYIVYTKGLLRTKDFKKWDKISWPHSSMFVNHFEWAPEFFKDKHNRIHVIMAGRSVKTNNFQLYISDFDQEKGKIKNNWKLLSGKDFPSNMIDGNLTYYNGHYVLFYKNEDVSKNKMTIATSDNYLGPYVSHALNIDLRKYAGAEGIEAVLNGNQTRLYFDPYKFNKNGQSIYNGVHYAEWSEKNKWSNIKEIKAPFIVRHFGILQK